MSDYEYNISTTLTARQFEEKPFPEDKEKFDIKAGTYQGHNVLPYKPWQIEKYIKGHLHYKGRYGWQYGGHKSKLHGHGLKQSQTADISEFNEEENWNKSVEMNAKTVCGCWNCTNGPVQNDFVDPKSTEQFDFESVGEYAERMAEIDPETSKYLKTETQQGFENHADFEEYDVYDDYDIFEDFEDNSPQKTPHLKHNAEKTSKTTTKQKNVNKNSKKSAKKSILPPQKLYVNVSNVTSEWFENSGININKVEKLYGVTITWKNADPSLQTKFSTENSSENSLENSLENEIKSGAVKPAKEVLIFTIIEATNSGNDETRARLIECVMDNFWSGDQVFFYKFYFLKISDRKKFEQFSPSDSYTSLEALKLPNFAVEYICKCSLKLADEFGRGHLFMQTGTIDKIISKMNFSIHQTDNLLAKLKLLQQTDGLQIIPDTDFYGHSMTRMKFPENSLNSTSIETNPENKMENKTENETENKTSQHFSSIPKHEAFEMINSIIDSNTDSNMDSGIDSKTLNSSAYDGLEICIGHDSADYNKVLILSKNKVVDKSVSAKILGSNCDFTVVSTKLTCDGDSERTDKLKVASQNLIQGVFSDGEFGFQCAELVKNRDDFQMTFNMPLDMLWAHLTRGTRTNNSGSGNTTRGITSYAVKFANDSDERAMKQSILDKINRLDGLPAKLYVLEESMCAVCWENKPNVLFLPCGHVITCVQCASNTDLGDDCPMCREPVGSRYLHRPGQEDGDFEILEEDKYFYAFV